jgi:hypothetical protein
MLNHGSFALSLSRRFPRCAALLGRIRMKQYVVDMRRAAFGWPFYITCNLVAYTLEQRGPAAKVAVGCASLLFAVFTTALWAALWLVPVWLILLLQ